MPVVDSDADLVKVLSHSGVVGLYGVTPAPDDAALKVAALLRERKHTVFLIDPRHAGETAGGQKVIASFWGVPRGVKIDLVVSFPSVVQPGEAMVDAAVTRHARYLWIEPGVLDLNVVGYAANWFEAVVLNRKVVEEYDRLLKGETPKEIAAPAFPPWWEAKHRLRRIPEGLE
ncbi:MAG: CoA-binding protein [bacterium]